MSDNPFQQSDDQLNASATGNPDVDAAPEPAVYKAMPDSRIPVSSKRGPLWRSRRDSAKKLMQNLVDAWDEAINYYNHDQQDHRDGVSSGMRSRWGNVSGNRNIARRLNEMFSSTEN